MIAVDSCGALARPISRSTIIIQSLIRADAIAAFIEQENLKDLTIVGHSFGGGITLALAMRSAEQSHPRIRNIVLIDSIAYKQPIPIFFRLLQFPMLGK